MVQLAGNYLFLKIYIYIKKKKIKIIINNNFFINFRSLVDYLEMIEHPQIKTKILKNSLKELLIKSN